MANRKKTKTPRKKRRPLPKVGTPKDNAYRMSHSQRDVVDFGRGGGPAVWTKVIAVGVIVLLVLGVFGLVFFT